MKEEQVTEFLDVLNKTSEVFGMKLTDGALTIWLSIFKNYSLSKFKTALQRCVCDTSKSGSFMPKPADVLRHLELSKEDQAMFAWDAVRKAIASYGSYESVCFDDKTIHAVVEAMGGWERVCALEANAFPFAEKEFVSRYVLLTNAPKEHMPESLVGKIERDRRAKGIESIPEAILVRSSYSDAYFSSERGSRELLTVER